MPKCYFCISVEFVCTLTQICSIHLAYSNLKCYSGTWVLMPASWIVIRYRAGRGLGQRGMRVGLFPTPLANFPRPSPPSASLIWKCALAHPKYASTADYANRVCQCEPASRANQFKCYSLNSAWLACMAHLVVNLNSTPINLTTTLFSLKSTLVNLSDLD